MDKANLLEVAKPILFNTSMVQAILEGRKTVTRRVCKEIANYKFSWGLDREPYIGDYKTFTKTSTGKWDWVTLKNQWLYDLQTKVDESKPCLLKPKYKVGDILYIRETWSPVWVRPIRYLYKASQEDIPSNTPIKWHPSIHMPKAAARIFLKVTGVRVERLQDISFQGIKNEGVKATGVWDCVDYLEAFEELWNSTIKKQALDKYSWESNPWVWVIEFERVEVEQ